MKFFLLIAATLMITSQATGQVQWSVFAGPQLNSASYAVQSVKQKTSYKPGFQLGMGLKVPFEGSLYFAPAVYYSLKGYKVEYSRFVYPPAVNASRNNTTFHTVELAALLQYDFNSQPGHFYIKAGPSLDFQVFGKEKFDTLTGQVDRSIPFGYDKYGHYSANMLLQLGYELKNGFFVHGQYTHGLANINNNDYGPSIRHRVFGITVGKYICTSKN